MSSLKHLHTFLRRGILLNALFPVILLSILVFHLVLENHEENVLRQAVLSAEVVAGEMDHALAGPEEALRQIALLLEYADAYGVDVDRLFDEALEKSGFFQSISLLDDRGRVKNIGLPEAIRPYRHQFLGVDLSGAEAVRHVLGTHEGFWTDIYLSLVSGLPRTAFMLPVRQGILTVALDLEQFTSLINLPKEVHWQPAVVDRKGQMLVGSLAGLSGPNANHLDIDLVQSGVSGRVDQGFFTFRGREFVGAVSPIPHIGWTAFVYAPKEVAYAGTRRIWMIFVLSILGSWGFVILFSSILSRKMSTPFLALSRAAGLISQGNYEAQIPGSDIREIDDLSKSLKALTEAVAERESSLRANAAELEAIFAATTEGVILYDMELNILRENARAAELCRMGDSLPTFATLGECSESKRPLDLEGNVLPFDELPPARALKGEVVIDSPVQFRDPRRGEVFLSVSARQVRDADEEILGVLMNFHDVTFRMKMENDLRFRETEYHNLAQEFLALFNGITEPIIVLDRDLNVLWSNDASQENQGIWPGGKCFRQFHHRSEPCPRCPTMRSFQSGTIAEEVIKGDDGKSWGVKAFPVQDQNGTVIKVIKLASDITEKMRIRDLSMRESRLAALGELAAGVAHEINNPNALILMNAPVVNEALADALTFLEMHYKENGDFPLGKMNFSRMQKILPQLQHEIYEGAQKIGRIVEELKDFARTDSGNIGDNFDINEACRKAVRLSRNMIRNSTDHFSAEFGEGIPPVRGSLQKLEQVVVNILVNACQALPDKSRGLRLRTRIDEEKSRVRIEIEDDGVGVKPEDMPHLLDPFFTTKRQSGGTGLGLSISVSLLKEMNGELQFSSEPGHGTLFTITLPYEVLDV